MVNGALRPPVGLVPRSPLRRSRWNQTLGLAAWLLVTFAAAALGAFASADAGDFYQRLARPDWAPPARVFGPVWTALYLLMAIAAWLVWRTYGFRRAGPVLVLYIVQLAANALWTWLFFFWRLGGPAFVEILVLWVLIIATMVAFWSHRRLAALLLLPYLAWVSLAAALNFVIWRLNPQLLA